MDWIETYSDNLKTELRYKINERGLVSIEMQKDGEWIPITNADRLVDVLANYAIHNVPAEALTRAREALQS